MKNENTIKLKYSNDTTYNSNYLYNPPCNCCNCNSSFCFCYCQCRCHRNKNKENEETDFENAPNLNINELKMNLLKDYSYQNNQNINNMFNPSLKNININSSRNNLNNENLNNNGKHLISLTKRVDNNLGKINDMFINKSQDVNYLNNQKNFKTYKNEKNDLLFKEVASHYKTQSNFNNLKKYYQLNNNYNINNNKYDNTYDNISNRSNLKSQIEFNKLLNSIKGNDNNIINNNISIDDIQKKYNIFTERETRHFPKTNGYDISSIRSSNNSLALDIQQLNNGLKNTFNFDRINKLLENNKEQNNKFNDFCSNTEYNKPFRPQNRDNGNILNLNKKNININNNTSVNISSDNYISNSSKDSFRENNTINQNGGNDYKGYKEYMNHSKKLNQNIKNVKLEDDSVTYNTSNINKSYNKLMQNLEIISKNYSTTKLSNTEPRYTNSSKNSDNDNVNIKFNYLDSSHNVSENKSELMESKDVNGDNNNNFIVTFGAKGNSELKNIISSMKSDLNSPNNSNNIKKNNGKGNENSDQKINNIIIDYENLKKRYEPNKLFTGLQNNIKDLNDNININKNLNISNDNITNISNIKTNNDINYTIYNFNIQIKGESNNKNENIIQENENYKKEINNLNNELKESKDKIEELMNIVNNYQKEINYLREQIAKQSKRDLSMNESKNTINNMNNVSVSNNNVNTSQKSSKTKIGKDSFIIKIPENLLKNNFNKEKRSRNSLSNNRKTTNNNNYSNISINTSRNIQDRYINLNSNINNYNNISNQLSFINNSNSNCFTYNNVSSNNISNNTITNINNEIYVKKITTTMRKKMKKSASQKLRVNKIYNNLSLNNQDLYIRNNEYSTRNNKLIYTLFNNNNKIKILSFDICMKQFNVIKLFDYDNFMYNYSESYNQQNNNILNNNSIFLLRDNQFYVVTGKNNDILYKLNNNNNTMNVICKFKNNHTKGCLFSFEDNIFCLSGYHNKKFEMFSEIDNTLISLDEMNIERSNFSVCIFKNKYIFALFGYNYPTHQCLDTIEFYELSNISNISNYINNNYNNNNKSGWRYLKYKNNNYLDLNIEGHICFNSNDEKIIFFGGFNGIKSEPIDCFYELVLDIDDFENEQSNKDVYVSKLNNNLYNIYQNKCYFFGNNNGLLLEDNNNMLFTAFDSNFHAHIIQTNNLSHNIYYFQ